MSNRVRIAGAVGVGVVIIALAFQASARDTTSQPSLIATVSAAPVRESITETDSNNDGTPDWQDAFQTITTPSASGTSSVSGNAPYTAPTTLTGKFSEAFLQDYLQEKMEGKDFKDSSAFVTTAVGAIEKNTQSIVHTRTEVVTIPTTQESARAYGTKILAIVQAHSPQTPTENEMVIFSNALKANDPSQLAPLEDIADNYAAVISDTLTVPVPDAFVVQHLALLNAYEGVYSDIRAAQKGFTDPLLALARVRNYDTHAESLLTAYILIAKALVGQGVTYGNDELGSFYTKIETMSPTPQ